MLIDVQTSLFFVVECMTFMIQGLLVVEWLFAGPSGELFQERNAN